MRDFELDEDDDAPAEGSPTWMATFADMATLLLTFFVLLLSFANVDVTRFRVALGSVKDALGVQFEHPGDVTALATSVIELSKQESTPNLLIIDEIQLLQRVRQMIQARGLEDRVEVDLGDRGVILRLKDSLLFDTAEDRVRSDAVEPLESIVELAEAIPFPIAVEGHTDDIPIKNPRFRSNWELSTARAISALRYLEDKGVDPTRLSVGGYADMKPLATNETSDGRAQNRRVEFVFITPVHVEQEVLDHLRQKDLQSSQKMPPEAEAAVTSRPTADESRGAAG